MAKPSVRRLIEKRKPKNGNDQIKTARNLIAILSDKLSEDFTHGYMRVDCPVLSELKYADKLLSEKQLDWVCSAIAREFGGVEK